MEMDERLFYRADLIAIRLEELAKYIVKKCRWLEYQSGELISEEELALIISNYKCPIVLSDSYIDPNKGEITSGKIY